MKEVIDLHLFKITNNPTSDKETRKVGALASGLAKPDFTLTDTADTLKAKESSRTTAEHKQSGMSGAADDCVTSALIISQDEGQDTQEGIFSKDV